MGLDNILGAVKDNIEDIMGEAVSITNRNNIPENIPLEGNNWTRVEEISCVYVDMVNSTGINLSPQKSAKIYELFVKSLVKIFNEFNADYIDIKGDGAFALFSGKDSAVPALCSAVTFNTICQEVLENKMPEFQIKAHIGIDSDSVLVKRIGLRGELNNEVWVGKPVNIASKLSSLAEAKSIIVSDRAYSTLSKKDYEQYLIYSCGCTIDESTHSPGNLWEEKENQYSFLKLNKFYILKSLWCSKHGCKFCDAVMEKYRENVEE